ncbi:MAG: hypothetical protein MJE68_32505, partial [Proteobacteria bacterium]|nr:hypothetical protein [Pseudomonadota bacterium]
NVCRVMVPNKQLNNFPRVPPIMFVYGNHAPDHGDALPPSVWHQWCSLVLVKYKFGDPCYTTAGLGEYKVLVYIVQAI